MEVIGVEHIGQTTNDEFVYDLETEEGTYLAGGKNGIIVKNTDSCYVKFDINREDFETETDFMKENFRVAIECADMITKTFKNPIDLEFEKFMYPFFLYQKKRYAYQEWTEPEAPHGELEYKGIQIVRRDNCKYVKEVCGKVFNILMKERDQEKAMDYVKEATDDLFNGNVAIEKLVLSKQLKGSYKVSGKLQKWTNSEINMPHVKLAQRLAKIDPMNSPKPPDRVPYVFVVTKNKKALQWERVEHPDYLEENNKKIDTLYYFERQLKSPIDMIFELMIDDPQILYKTKMLDKRNAMQGMKSINNYFRRNTKSNKELKDEDKKVDDAFAAIDKMMEEEEEEEEEIIVKKIVKKFIYDDIVDDILKENNYQENQENSSDFLEKALEESNKFKIEKKKEKEMIEQMELNIALTRSELKDNHIKNIEESEELVGNFEEEEEEEDDLEEGIVLYCTKCWADSTEKDYSFFKYDNKIRSKIFGLTGDVICDICGETFKEEFYE